jgi:hypothetical protein
MLSSLSSSSQEVMILGEEVEVVLRMEVEKGIRTAKFFMNSREIIERIKVILRQVEAVSVVWVKPFVMVNGKVAFLFEMLGQYEIHRLEKAICQRRPKFTKSHSI